MTLRYADAGLTVFLVLFMVSGCGLTGRRIVNGMDALPVSNVRILEQAVLDALENTGIPEGGDVPVNLRVEGDDVGETLLTVLAPGFFDSHGYDVLGPDSQAAVLVVRAETMSVSLNVERKLLGRDKVVRRADAVLTIETGDHDGLRKVYRGSSIVSDEFPANYLPLAVDDKTFSVVHDDGSILSGKHGKPLVLGLTMTALAWLLYAYRG